MGAAALARMRHRRRSAFVPLVPRVGMGTMDCVRVWGNVAECGCLDDGTDKEHGRWRWLT